MRDSQDRNFKESKSQGPGQNLPRSQGRELQRKALGRLLTLALMTSLIGSSRGFAQEISLSPDCYPVEPNRSAKDIMVGKVISEDETFARLVFAEGLSANVTSRQNCHQVEPQIYELIAWGVWSRVRLGERLPSLKTKYGEGLRGVIFKPSQFNPAVSPKSDFRKYFLCPKEAKDFALRWKWTRDAIRKVRAHPKASPFQSSEWERNEHTSLVSHFYYPLSTQATPRPPSWANPAGPARVKGLSLGGTAIPDECIWFFRHESPPGSRTGGNLRGHRPQ